MTSVHQRKREREERGEKLEMKFRGREREKREVVSNGDRIMRRFECKREWNSRGINKLHRGNAKQKYVLCIVKKERPFSQWGSIHLSSVRKGNGFPL